MNKLEPKIREEEELVSLRVRLGILEYIEAREEMTKARERLDEESEGIKEYKGKLKELEKQRRQRGAQLDQEEANYK